MKEVTCNKCGKVHFTMTLKEVEKEIKSFGLMYEKLSAEQKLKYYGNKPVTMETYTHCYFCGNAHSNFRPSLEQDAPIGVTICGILDNE
ncbi:MAG: hypothetical protein E3J23_02995 [Candidatus Stahlbacteria bacterium]|nr:MAG: hypothetical protein E3J23_02995 [Candidatus Stahlbacteria bacterium]